MNRWARRGVQVVEFSLIAPVLISMGMGALDYGWYLNQRVNFTDTVNSTCRMAVNNTGQTDAQYKVMIESEMPLQLVHAGVISLTSDIQWGVANAPSPASWVAFNVVSGVNLMTVNVVAPYTPIVGLVPMPATFTYQYTVRL